MDNKTIKEIQLLELDLLKKFVALCEEHKLRYYIFAGTFLGAVRNKGFIPWDDDIDVAMPREDYERFLQIAPEVLDEHTKLACFKLQKNVVHYFAKLENMKVNIVETIANIPRKGHIWIDIFPLDGLPNNKLIRKIHGFHLLVCRALLKLSLFNESVDCSNTDRPIHEKILMWIGKRINFSKIFNSDRCMWRVDRNVQKYGFYDSVDIMNFMGSLKLKSTVNREKVFGNGAIYLFEGLELVGPRSAELYLSHVYGADYMELPPEDQRISHAIEVVR